MKGDCKNLITSLVFAVAGLLGVLQAWKLGLWKDSGPAGGLFPFSAALGILLLSTCSILMELISHGGSSEIEERIDWKKLILYTGTLIGIAIALESVGYVTTIGTAFIFILRVLERLSWPRTVLVTAATLIVSTVLFEKLLKINLPHGFLW